MHKINGILSIIVLLIAVLPANALTNQQIIENKSDRYLETEKTILVIHSNSGQQKSSIYLTKETIDLLKSDFKNVEILDIVPEEIKIQVEKLMDDEAQRLATSNIKDLKNPILSFISKIYGLDISLPLSKQPEIVGWNNTYINYLCAVKGIGLLLLFPPFIPITPILYAGLLLINTNGLNGAWNVTVDHSLMIPFVGLSLWTSGLYVFTGISGFVIAVQGKN